MKDLEDAISPNDLLSMDQLKQAEAFRKLLLLAGLEERDFEDEELLETLQKIVRDFDPNAPINTDDAIFQV